MTRSLIIISLLAAFWLRVWGLDFGLPYDFHPDEHQYVDVALRWYLTGQMELRFVNPPLFTYLLAAAFWGWFALAPYAPTPEVVSNAYVLARLWSVFFGLLTVALLYPLGRLLYDRRAGLLALVLMSGLFLPAREAHFAVNDALVTFLVLLAIYFGLVVWRRGGWPAYLAAGAATGLAAGAKLTGALVIVALLAGHAFRAAERGEWLPRRLWLGLGAALVAFGLVSVHIFWHMGQFIDGVVKVVRFGAEGHKGLVMTPASGWQFYLDALGWGIGWPLVAAGGLALAWVAWRRRPDGLILMLFSVGLFAYMGRQKAVSARYILPAVPPLVALVGLALARLASRWPRGWAWLGPLLVAGLLAQPLANLARFDYLLTRPDTRQLATDWFSRQYPSEDTVVVRENYSIFPRMVFLSRHWPYKIVTLDELGPARNNVDYYTAHKTDFIVLSSFTYSRVRQDPAEEAARQAQLAFVEERAELVKSFSPFRASFQEDWFYFDQLYGPARHTWQRVRPGPLIHIYRLPYENQPYLEAMPSIASPTQANFGDKLMLLGYELANRRAEPGGAFTLTLYWQALDRMQENYVVFDHLLDEHQHNWGGRDRWPQETAKTSLWRPGEVVVDTFNVPVAADAPPGIYTLDIGLYAQADRRAEPLPLVREGQAIDQNSVRIGPLKVGHTPPEGVLWPEQAAPQYPLGVELGDPPLVLAAGYDLTVQSDRLYLKLYWQSLAQTPVDWSVFVHVRSQANETIGQKDGPVGSGRYPTSLWDPGDRVVDELEISLPPNLGQYTLVTGLYDLQTGRRLSVPGQPANEITLDVEHE